MTKPVLLVTNQVPPDRAGALAELNNAEVIKIAIYDGKQHHGSAGLEDPGVPFIRSSQQGIYRLAASGRYRAVIATSAGRIALPAAYAGARRAGVPFIYWTGIWHQISTPLHLAAAPLVRWIESHSDAVGARRNQAGRAAAGGFDLQHLGTEIREQPSHAVGIRSSYVEYAHRRQQFHDRYVSARPSADTLGRP